jgi:hypothetical protein
MLERHRMTAVVIASRRNLSLNEQEALVERHWDALNEVFDGGEAGLYHLTQGGIRRMERF